MKASIVIPARNAAATISLVLESLKKQNLTDFEVVLVDDASTDATSVIAKKSSDNFNLRIIRNDENLGRAQARNLGVRESRGEITLLLDSDIEVAPDYVSTHLRFHDQTARGVGVGALRYPPHLARKALARYYGSRGGARLKPDQPLPGKCFASGLASFPRLLFNEVGGFDPRFRFYGGEDLELGLRFQKAGAQMRYLPDAIGYHQHLRPLKQVIAALEKYGESGIPLLLEAHPEFAAELFLDDLIADTDRASLKTLLRRMICSATLFQPLYGLANLLEDGWLPAPLLTYLHYRSYRKGFQRHASKAVLSPLTRD